jgi:cytochrome b
VAGQRIKLWDWPVRVIHWSLVLLMPALWWTWKSGQMFVHTRLGYVVLALVAFRLFWGLVGSSPARFASFVRGPRAIGGYLGKLFRARAEPSVGHNPLGGLSVLALLALILGVVGTGLFCEDTDGLNSGPLNYRIQGDLSEGMAHWHHLLFNLLLGFIALHILAVAFYAVVKRENLVGPMITGRRAMAAPAIPPRFAPVWRIVVGVVLALALIWWVSLGAPLTLPLKA